MLSWQNGTGLGIWAQMVHEKKKRKKQRGWRKTYYRSLQAASLHPRNAHEALESIASAASDQRMSLHHLQKEFHCREMICLVDLRRKFVSGAESSRDSCTSSFDTSFDSPQLYQLFRERKAVIRRWPLAFVFSEKKEKRKKKKSIDSKPICVSKVRDGGGKKNIHFFIPKTTTAALTRYCKP